MKTCWLMPLLALLALASSCNRGSDTAPSECDADGDCSEAEPHCFNGFCVECAGGDDCGCHQACEENRCIALGAADPVLADHAHGTWTGTPGTGGYVFTGTCGSDSDCAFGQICNPLTAGCLDAGRFQQACGAGRPDCPAGFECVSERFPPLCLPRALCASTTNCCGGQDFVCSALGGNTGLCIPDQQECTPPEVITSTSPFLPKTRGGLCGGEECCDLGSFCSHFGACVECLTDLDCRPSGIDNGLHCNEQELKCRSETFCNTSADCGGGQSCDAPNHACKPRCDASNEDAVCSATEFCLLDLNVCRPISERQCEADTYEDNDTPAEAVANGSTLVPPPMNGTAVREGFSLCVGDEDWYAVPLQAGDHLVVDGRGIGPMQGNMTAFAPDGVTRIGNEGFFGSLPIYLELTANVTAVHFLRVSRFEDAVGFYNLTLARSAAPACVDDFEFDHGSNDTPDRATLLYDAADPELPEPCTATAGGDGVRCESQRLCDGDVDYYVISAPAGAEVEALIEGFTNANLDLSLFGPFADAGSVASTPVIASTSGLSGVEVLRTIARQDAAFLLRVFRTTGGISNYQLEVRVQAALAACPEDAYDGAAAGLGSPAPATLVLDPAGLNDSAAAATAVALPGAAVLTLDSTPLSACRADADWFELGRQDGDEVAPPSPGRRIAVSLEVDAASPAGAVTLAGGFDGALDFGSDDPALPSHSLLLPPSDGTARPFVKVSGAPSNAGHVLYRLRAEVQEPPACAADALGDTSPGDADNDAPAVATLLAGSDGWPTALGQSFEYVASGAGSDVLTLCPNDDDWYRIVVPAGLQALAWVIHDPANADIELRLYSGVGGVNEPTAGDLPTVGVLDAMSQPGFAYHEVRGAITGDAYIVVTNRSGWPLLDYRLGVAFLPAACTEDDLEPESDAVATAPALPTAPLFLDRQTETGLTRGLAMCTGGTERDFYEVALQPGDAVTARVLYRPVEGDIDLSLHAPGVLGQSLDGDTDATGGAPTGRLEVSWTAQSAGDYLLQVSPVGTPRNFYTTWLTVERSCVDDDLEPAPPAELGTLAWAPSLSSHPQQLCYDEDWLRLDVPAGVGDVTVCTTYARAEAFLALEVYGGVDTSNPAVPAGTGAPLAAGHDYDGSERVVIARGSTAAATYYVRAYPDYPRPPPFAPPHPFAPAYRLWLQQGDVACPPAICDDDGDCGAGTCDEAANAGAGDCLCDLGWDGERCDVCADTFYGASCALQCSDCGPGGLCDDGFTGTGCLFGDGQPCPGGDGDCVSDICAPDVDGAGTFCAAAGTCVYDQGGTVALRPAGWVECAGDADYQVCEVDGSWSAGASCDARTCDPGSEGPACGFLAAAANTCVSGMGEGTGGGCAFDLGTATCADCGPYGAGAAGCNDAPPAVSNCDLTCGAACDDTTPPTSTGTLYCLSDVLMEQVDGCDDTCTVSDAGAADLVVQDCTACGGTCDDGVDACVGGTC